MVVQEYKEYSKDHKTKKNKRRHEAETPELPPSIRYAAEINGSDEETETQEIPATQEPINMQAEEEPLPATEQEPIALEDKTEPVVISLEDEINEAPEEALVWLEELLARTKRLCVIKNIVNTVVKPMVEQKLQTYSVSWEEFLSFANKHC